MIFWLYPPRRGSHTVLEERFQGPEVHVFSQFSVVVGHLCKRLGLMAPSALALCFPANVKCTRQLEETAGASVCWISQRTGFRNLQFPRCDRETLPSVSDPWPGHVDLTEAKGEEKFLVPDICTVGRGEGAGCGL